MKPLFDCILFDLDGTLADTAPDLGGATFLDEDAVQRAAQIRCGVGQSAVEIEQHTVEARAHERLLQRSR